MPEETLPDPLNDRVISRDQLPLPPNTKLSIARAFNKDPEKPDYELIENYMESTGQISKELFLELCRLAESLLVKEPNLLRIQGKCLMVGDIHG